MLDCLHFHSTRETSKRYLPIFLKDITKWKRDPNFYWNDVESLNSERESPSSKTSSETRDIFVTNRTLLSPQRMDSPFTPFITLMPTTLPGEWDSNWRLSERSADQMMYFSPETCVNAPGYGLVLIQQLLLVHQQQLASRSPPAGIYVYPASAFF